MTSVLYSSGGYNIGGNQLRVDLRNTNNRLDNLLQGMSTLEALFVKLHPENATEIQTAFSNVLNPSSTPAAAPVNPTPLPPARNNVQTAGVNRVRA
jgi:hypothetical protein